MKAADDYAAINRRMQELQQQQPDWMPRCKDCMDLGWRRDISKNGWIRVPCPACGNPEEKP